MPDPSPGVGAWRAGLLALALAGAWIGRRNPAMVPWTAFLASKVIVTLAFFGYARQGAIAIPVVALLACVAVTRAVTYFERRPSGRRRAPRPRGRLLVAGALLLLAVEAGRCAARPEVRLDGRPIGAEPLDSPDDHRDRRVEVK